MNKRKNIICNNCGAVYFSDDLPTCLKCTCFGEDFKFAEIKT